MTMATERPWLQLVLLLELIIGSAPEVNEESIAYHPLKEDTMISSGISMVLHTVTLATTISLLIYLFYLFCRNKAASLQRRRNFIKNGGSFVDRARASLRVGTDFRLYTYEELDIATLGFCTERLIAEGGQGTVFKALLRGLNNVAIKRANTISQHLRETFIEEAAILTNVKHDHIIRLHGLCLDSQYPLLVYAFIDGGDLYTAIKNVETNKHSTHSTRSTRSWKENLKILTNIADAVAYLHSLEGPSKYGICHRDIKLDNILIDRTTGNAYLADFGLAQINITEGVQDVDSVVGTFGYLDPVIWQTLTYSTASDVYSFGVVMAQVLLGKCASGTDFMNGFIADFLIAVKAKREKDALDSRFDIKRKQIDQLWNVAYMACACLRPTRDDRPCMKKVADMLHGHTGLLAEYANNVILHNRPDHSLAIPTPTGSTRSSSSSSHRRSSSDEEERAVLHV